MKQKYWWIGIVIVAAAFLGYKLFGQKKTVQYATSYTVAQQDVRQSVLATGTVTSKSNLSLSFKNSGTLAGIKVDVGSKVHTGDILATLDQKDASASVSQAKAAVLSAQANYEKVVNGATGADVDVAKAAVAAAQVNYNNAKSALDTASAQQKVLVANAFSAMLNSGIAALPTTTNLSSATIAMSGTYTGTQPGNYKITLGTSGAGYTYSFSGLENGDGLVVRGTIQPLGTSGLYFSVSSAGQIFANDTWNVPLPNTQASTYLANYNAYQSALQTQTQTLATAKNNIDAMQAALDQAKAQLALKQSAARPEDIKAAQAQINTAQAQLQAAGNAYENNIIRAPIDGVITSVDTKIGESVQAQKEVVILLDQSSLHVESNIAESSIAKVAPGQPIDMTFDAFGPDKHFNGTVISIDPAAVVSQGVINFKVISSIPSDPNIKPGMTANLTIILADKPNTLAIPNRLIKSQGNGKVVTVLQNDQPVDIAIQTGLVGDTYTEITAGADAGVQLVTPAK